MAFRKISSLLQEVSNSVDIAEFVCKSIFGSFWIFVVTGQGKHAVIFSQGTQKIPNIHPIKIAYLVQVIKLSGNLPILV